ncbi:hypothetical protein B7L88_gp062 [Rhizobium phage RHEph10]|uniref:hypothetical protein n=1 Tax=Rhizobium phage RHEph10 TaxID=1220717 RepID=UPI0002AAFB74|nr:hypothetical protein B7L88_gp062 [Rhizobium phage RHEph10]AGC36106.1 hypothetical protein RHEph10_gp062 [Rhizobium phage RHEph10]
MADWIVQTRGKYRGRIGVVDLDLADEGGFVTARFGSDGPVATLAPTSIRKATQSEIAEKLGCKPADLPDYLKRSHPE